MPLNKNIKKVLVIGSGPIVIGQGAEFDYAGTQACRTLKEEGLEVVLINSNPATIMTDKQMADNVYIEPLTIEVIKKIIIKERPDSLLSTLGGQTGLTLSMKLAKEGFLDKMNVTLLGANPETIDKAEDRQIFKDTMKKINQPCIPSKVVTDVESAVEFVKTINYPVIVRPAFTLGGSGGGIVHNEEKLRDVCANGLRQSPINQVLIEKCISGWKEVEFEVVRDSYGNVITVCGMENFDPVGIHTGDSIVIAPTVTLSDKDYQMLRTASIKIIEEMKIEGGCNCQFALNPNSFEYAVIEVNPRVSRSSALASKATGYPIAKVATKIAIGYRLDEIINQVTGKTYASFEPALDYVVIKFPKWPFEKFVYAKRSLGTQMKATGEVMAIGTSFEQAIMKAVRGAELSLLDLNVKKFKSYSNNKLLDELNKCTDQRLFIIYELLKRDFTIENIHDLTKIDKWFLSKLLNIVNLEKKLSTNKINDELYIEAKNSGFLDITIEQLSNSIIPNKKNAVYKMVDTCSGEFEASTPYFYSTYDDENEADLFIDKTKENKRIIVFGAGPIRIGQGIEFDYCSVHCVMALRKLGYEVAIVNNNPETVSTDFDTANRLYFDPLTEEDVMNVINTEEPLGVVVAFGGQTAIKLTKFLESKNINILGTNGESIDIAEDREKFDAFLEKCNILRPIGSTVFTTDEALDISKEIGFPVLLRPSYVLGGQNMIIAHNEDDIVEYMDIILATNIENPILIDKYLRGTEVEVDAICDGDTVLIPGIMEHIERAGVHSGDSIAIYPAINIKNDILEVVVNNTIKIAKSLKVKGLVNIQYVISDGKVYVIEVNPRSSRTVPYISKVTDVPLVELATRIMVGEKLANMGYKTGLYKKSKYIAVKVPIFSFEKLHGVDTHLGPEMKSTGEVLGVSTNFEEAIFKGLIGAGYSMKKTGGVLISIKDSDKPELLTIGNKLKKLGLKIYATGQTCKILNDNNINAELVEKIGRSEKDIMWLLESGKVNYVISTSEKGRVPANDSVKIRRKTVNMAIPCLTSLDTANALLDSLLAGCDINKVELFSLFK